jgi:hypothetical protein
VRIHAPKPDVPDKQFPKMNGVMKFEPWGWMPGTGFYPAGAYQSAYSHSLNQGQLETLMDNSLAACILELAESLKGKEWSGTPRDLLVELIQIASIDTQKSRDWPQNPISLSKRLIPLQAGLLTQGVSVQLHRGKHRTITISQAVADSNVADVSATETDAPPPPFTF